MATTPTAVAAGFVEQTLRFVYDYLGGRVRKEVFGEGSALVSRTIWIYDGWNMIAEYDQPAIGGALTLKRSYAWGLDLLGSLRASGGVGALLQLRDYSENATYLAGYDGNGNLTTLQNAATGTLAATYEYGPFGEPIATSGAYADKNPVRFSTKYTDDETGLVYYGRRYYDPRNGRFLGRDPIEENGGRNLYGFVGNEPINRGDRLGMEAFITWSYHLDAFGNFFTFIQEDDYAVAGGSGILRQGLYGLLGLDALFAGSRMPVYGTPTPYSPPAPPPPEPPSKGLYVLAGPYSNEVKAQLAILRELKRPDGELSEIAKIIRELENASVRIEIDGGHLSIASRMTTGYHAFEGSDATNGVGTGGQVVAGPPNKVMDYGPGPNGTRVVGHGIDVLAHELVHARDAMLGREPLPTQDEPKRREYEAIRVQNQVIAILRPEAALRYRHQTHDIPDFAKYVTWEHPNKNWTPPNYDPPADPRR